MKEVEEEEVEEESKGRRERDRDRDRDRETGDQRQHSSRLYLLDKFMIPASDLNLYLN
jgi:hypothetical protein